MTEDKTPEINGPPNKPTINHRHENTRGGRGRFSRFGPHHERERDQRPSAADQVLSFIWSYFY